MDQLTDERWYSTNVRLERIAVALERICAHCERMESEPDPSQQLFEHLEEGRRIAKEQLELSKQRAAADQIARAERLHGQKTNPS